MSLLNSQQENSITALIAALEQQDEALPAGLQKQLHAIGQNLENRAVEIPAVAASLPGLHRAYQEALADAQTDAGPKATLVSTSTPDDRAQLIEQATQIFTDPDPVQAAQKNTFQKLGQIAANPLKNLFGRG